jgi:phage terminase large subunit-like protein
MTAIPRSKAERLALAPPEERAAFFRQSAKTLIKKEEDWDFWCRDDQHPPAGDWRCWLVMAGRGFGKTRMAAEWVRAQAVADGTLHIALIAATYHEARTIMVEGESGLRSIGPWDERPVFEPSLKRLTWKNGARATLYSAAEPEALRGPEHHIAWADEIAKWDNGVAAWDTLAMTLRLGARPRIVATTTPRPVPLMRRLLGESDVAVTRGALIANKAQLPSSFVAAMGKAYGQTRLGRQELSGELIEDVAGALWSRGLIEGCRIAPSALPSLTRVVIGVDPPASATGDACGIIAAALGDDGRAYVLGDHSVTGCSPEGWARAVSAAATLHQADRVIAEANQGGDMVVSTLRAASVAMPVKKVHASRGKSARAEPVAALYEAGRVAHVGGFAALEDEMCAITGAGGYHGPGRSPDRADALVWALSELMLGGIGQVARVRVL